MQNVFLGQGNISQVFFCLQEGVGFPACITGHMTRGSSSMGGLPPRGEGLHPGGGSTSRLPSKSNITEYSQQAGGTHPTEMHSCIIS